MLSFFAAGFAVAALIAATGPILIHLFNRRRYRTVDWAAMDFLREALRRNRKVLQIRDLLILALRCLCVLCFGFALARPFLTTGNASPWPLILGGTAIVVALGAAVSAIAAHDRLARNIAGAVCAVASLLAAWGGYAVVQTGADPAAAAVTDRSPVHAVLLVDNSLSMGYESLGGTLLDQAKAKALEFVDRLPPESRVSVIPLCGSPTGFTVDAYRNREDALDALRRIEVVDLGASAASASRAIELAAQACEKVPELDAKRVVLLGDQQAINWPAEGMPQALATIPELQVVHVGPEGIAENLAVTEFRVRDGIADVETPASFLATVSYQGRDPLNNVLVTLTVDGAVVASQTVEMQPDQSRQVEFKHQFDVNVDPGQPAFVPATVSVECDGSTGDRLPRDNRRHLSVPVVAGLPIVFVDQYGAEENAEKNRLGDTYALRRWLAPRMSRDDVRRQLIRIRHTTIDRLDQSHLEDARLAVIAGVAGPGDKTPLLRQFVQQGGRLVIAAGGQFDPVAWNEQGWLDGAGILPAPLKATPVGETPEEAIRKQTLDPFFLAFSSLQHDYFLIEGESRGFLEDFYKTLFFFKAIEADVSPELVERTATAEAARIEADRAFLDEAAKRAQEWAEKEKNGTFGPADQALRAQDEERGRTIDPQWLLWRRERAIDESAVAVAALAERGRPRVLGQFTRESVPFLVEREIGAGRVLFVATSIFSRGALSDWNNLTKDNPVLLFDRIVRTQLEETLPRRNFDSGERIALPADRGGELRYTLERPRSGRRDEPDAAGEPEGEAPDLSLVSKREETLSVDALGADSFGVSIRNATQAGHYVVTARRTTVAPASLTAVSFSSDAASASAGEKQREIALAVNGPASESELRSLDSFGLRERLGTANYRWIERDEPIALEGARVRGRDLWKWLAGVCLAGLLLEMCVVSWPVWRASLAIGGRP